MDYQSPSIKQRKKPRGRFSWQFSLRKVSRTRGLALSFQGNDCNSKLLAQFSLWIDQGRPTSEDAKSSLMSFSFIVYKMVMTLCVSQHWAEAEARWCTQNAAWNSTKASRLPRITSLFLSQNQFHSGECCP